MSKADFLKELQARLAVLEAGEQQDILEEYAQHIDMRVAGGLTEDEAILDFGDLDQLVKLILEAYHVDPAYRQAPPPPAAKPEAGERCRAGLTGVWHGAGRFFTAIGHGISGCFRAVGGWFRRIGQAIADLFRRRPRPEQAAGLPAAASRQPGAAAHLGSRLAAWGRGLLRIGWNLLLLLCALPFGAAGVAGLVALGVTVVLVAQGYPLAGPLLILVGGLLSIASILALGSSLICRRQTDGAPEQDIEEAYDDEIQ